MTLDAASDSRVRSSPTQDTLRQSSNPAVLHSFPDDRVFSDVPAASSLSSPRGSVSSMPGIVLTVEEGGRPIVINNIDSPICSSRVSDRSLKYTTPVHSQMLQRSPSHGRMRRNASNNRLGNSNMHHGSPGGGQPHGHGVSRSQSMRTARRPQSLDPSHRFRQRIASIPSDMILPGECNDSQRAASNHSLPLPGEEADVLRLRNFAVTPKGMVNRGDSFRSKSRSAHSVCSNGNSHRLVTCLTPPFLDLEVHKKETAAAASTTVVAPAASSAGTSSENAATVQDTNEESKICPETVTPEPLKYRVLVCGGQDVGKTSLVRQFMTSEYICAYDSSLDEENEKSVTVVLNGEEAELLFIEQSYHGDSNITNLPNPDAYIIVYSVTSKKSLQQAKELLRLVQKWEEELEMKTFILVGNKTDLVRLRVVSSDDGRSLAIEEGSKFIETSAGINHQVDELLAGIVSQIRLKMQLMDKQKRKRDSVVPGKNRRCAGCPGCKAKGLIKRILKKACSRSRSCDNLHVL